MPVVAYDHLSELTHKRKFYTVILGNKIKQLRNYILPLMKFCCENVLCVGSKMLRMQPTVFPYILECPGFLSSIDER